MCESDLLLPHQPLFTLDAQGLPGSAIAPAVCSQCSRRPVLWKPVAYLHSSVQTLPGSRFPQGKDVTFVARPLSALWLCAPTGSCLGASALAVSSLYPALPPGRLPRFLQAPAQMSSAATLFTEAVSPPSLFACFFPHRLLFQGIYYYLMCNMFHLFLVYCSSQTHTGRR